MYGYESLSFCSPLDFLKLIFELEILVFWAGAVCRIENVLLKLIVFMMLKLLKLPSSL